MLNNLHRGWGDLPMTFITGSGRGVMKVSFSESETAATEAGDELLAYQRIIRNASDISEAAEKAWDEVKTKAHAEDPLDTEASA